MATVTVTVEHGASLATPGVIYESSTADFTARVHHAMRPDGVWFVRTQYRDPLYGYKWGKWRRGAAPDRLRATGRKARLPK